MKQFGLADFELSHNGDLGTKTIACSMIKPLIYPIEYGFEVRLPSCISNISKDDFGYVGSIN